MKTLAYLLIALLSLPTFGQIGPAPNSSLNTWRVEESYSVGQAVIRNGVIYNSLINGNVAYDPAGSPSQWGTNFGSTFTLPTAGAAGQVLTATAPGTAYSAQDPHNAALPASPNVVYTFVAPGDQGNSTGVIHDISGNGNDATPSITPPVSPWTGLGWTLSNISNFSVLQTLPTAVSPDLSYCMAVFLPYQTNSAGTTTQTWAMVDSTAYQGWSFSMSVANALWSDFTNGPIVGSDSLPGSTESGFHIKCWTLGTGAGHPDHFYTDGIENQYHNQNSFGNGGQNVGNWYLAPHSGGVSLATLYYFAAWPTQISAENVRIASQSMAAAVAARGVQTTPNVFWYANPRFMAVGDSITCCGGASTTNWWPSLITINSAYGTPINEGIGGLPAEGMAAAAKWRDAPYCHGGGQRTTAVIYGGINEGYLGSATGGSANLTVQTALAGIQGYVSEMTSAGCQVGVVTMISCCNGSPALDTFKNQLNTAIRNGADQGNYFLIDSDDPNLQCDGCSASLTYFNSDHIHPTNAGQTLIAALISNAVNAYGIGSASSANPTVYSSNTVTMLSADRWTTIIPTSAATATLPDCLGVTGTVYQIFNASAGANTITFSGKASEAITGTATLAQNATARFQATLISQAAAGCGWQRIQ